MGEELDRALVAGRFQPRLSPSVDPPPHAHAVFGNRFRAALPPAVQAQAVATTGGFQVTDPASHRLVGDAFVAGLHLGYLVAAAALLVGTLFAVSFLRALRPHPAGMD